MKDLEKFSWLCVRLGLGFVFLWFGADKWIHTEAWFGFVHPVVERLLPFSVNIFLHVLGVIEIIFGALLVVGLFTRLAALGVVLLLAGISLTTGFTDITVRDLGLLGAALGLVFKRMSALALENMRKKRL